MQSDSTWLNLIGSLEGVQSHFLFISKYVEGILVTTSSLADVETEMCKDVLKNQA